MKERCASDASRPFRAGLHGVYVRTGRSGYHAEVDHYEYFTRHDHRCRDLDHGSAGGHFDRDLHRGCSEIYRLAVPSFVDGRCRV